MTWLASCICSRAAETSAELKREAVPELTSSVSWSMGKLWECSVEKALTTALRNSVNLKCTKTIIIKFPVLLLLSSCNNLNTYRASVKVTALVPGGSVSILSSSSWSCDLDFGSRDFLGGAGSSSSSSSSLVKSYGSYPGSPGFNFNFFGFLGAVAVVVEPFRERLRDPLPSSPSPPSSSLVCRFFLGFVAT